jgi:hypothetical protein
MLDIPLQSISLHFSMASISDVGQAPVHGCVSFVFTFGSVVAISAVWKGNGENASDLSTFCENLLKVSLAGSRFLSEAHYVWHT